MSDKGLETESFNTTGDGAQIGDELNASNQTDDMDDPYLEMIKASVKEMEEETESFNMKIQNEFEKLHNSSGSLLSLSYEDKMEIDARSVYFVNVDSRTECIDEEVMARSKAKIAKFRDEIKKKMEERENKVKQKAIRVRNLKMLQSRMQLSFNMEPAKLATPQLEDTKVDSRTESIDEEEMARSKAKIAKYRDEIKKKMEERENKVKQKAIRVRNLKEMTYYFL